MDFEKNTEKTETDVEQRLIPASSKRDNKEGTFWTGNITDKFPIHSILKRDEKTIVEVGAPHEGYKIETTLVNRKMNGKSTIFSESGKKIAVLTLVDGIATGPCKLYDESGNLYFEGYLKNGYREGRGKEYDNKGNVTFEDFYSNGERMKLIPMNEKKEYWKEFDEDGKLRSITRRDAEGKKYGLCYFYNNGNISRISEWKDGKEAYRCKQFDGGKMIEYSAGVIQYIGQFRDTFESNYVREGEGKIFDKDGKSMLYEGHLRNGKRHGIGKSYRNRKLRYYGRWINDYPAWILYMSYIIGFLLCTTALVLNMFIGSIVVGMVLSLLILKRIFSTRTSNFLNIFDFHEIGRLLSDSTEDNARNIGKRKTIYSKLTLHLFAMITIPLTLVFCFSVIYNIFWRPCNGYILQWSLTIESNRCKNALSFDPWSKSLLKKIIIKDNNFQYVSRLNIEGMTKLRELKIGSNSFTNKLNSFGKDTTKSFHILNCESLESIEIGEYSFSDYAGEFELKNLSKLESLIIGSNTSNSYNFYNTNSLMIESILIIDY